MNKNKIQKLYDRLSDKEKENFKAGYSIIEEDEHTARFLYKPPQPTRQEMIDNREICAKCPDEKYLTYKMKYKPEISDKPFWDGYCKDCEPEKYTEPTNIRHGCWDKTCKEEHKNGIGCSRILNPDWILNLRGKI